SSGGLLPFMEQRDLEEAKAIMQATINAMRKEKNPFTGILYGQFMLTASGVKVIEFNARFGDPEALNVLSLLKADLAEILVSMAEGKLKTASFSNDSTVVKYLVPDGYPDSGKAGQEVSINEKEIWNRGAKAYWGSVYEKEGKIYTSTSRTAAIVAHAPSLEEAESKVEQATAFVRGPLWHRRDIGTRELLRKRMEHIRRLKK
ncbi:MAG: phosphoribosylglycinamide synthetase C domain-containing protein, partial [Candidatus Bilamarchaeaceae archaeon]